MELTKEILDTVRHIEGFPIGKDEDIIKLSDPPYYTACPNPFINDFIDEYGTPYDEENDDYNVEPYTADVSEGKNDPIYNAHSYHTKVPHKAIMRYILHYTKPGDIVFDGFCGTGMTGVAAQMCENPDKEFKVKLEKEFEEEGKTIQWGERKAILNDLSPAATFIANNYVNPINIVEFIKEADELIKEVEKECNWVYKTEHTLERTIYSDITGETRLGNIAQIIWSDVFVCPNCNSELVYWNLAVDMDNEGIKDSFNCTYCNTLLSKRTLERAWQTYYSITDNKPNKMIKQVPVWINYSFGGKRFEKPIDKYDIELLDKINCIEVKRWYPTDRMIEGEESRRNDFYGITNVHHFFSQRNIYVLSVLFDKIIKRRNLGLLFVLTASLQRANKTNRFRYRGTGNLSGTLYIPSLIFERNVIELFKNKLNDFVKFKKEVKIKNTSITTNSSTDLNLISNNCIDYIFTDPPFGNNLMYSELNFIWEAWLRVFTNNKKEAIMNKTQSKNLFEYKDIIEKCFSENYRILKPGRWMTVEFHNSQNSVWNAIQEAILKAGFVIANVKTLDKKQGTFKQVTTTTAVKQDLIISAYKPKESFVQRFLIEAGTEEGAWSFIREHLSKLPVTVENNGMLDIIPERQNYLLYDSMVAFHIQKGATIPIGAADFYLGLNQRFPERDGMYFLPDQVSIYDDKRMNQELNEQISFLVLDEKTAIQWLRRELETPQTYQDIQPKFLQELKQLKYEKMPELRDLLEDNFLQDEKGKWYVPDVNKQSDLEKLRDKKLLKEFDEYREGKGKLKVFRTEAIRAGFKYCWKEKDYKTIVNIGERLPESVVQEDPSILMYYDNALTRMGN